MLNLARRSVVGVAGAALTGAAATITTGSRVAAAPGVASRPLRITVAGSSQRALNAVELSGGEYSCSGSVLLRSGVDVAGAGPALRHRPAGREQDEEVVGVTVGVG